MTSRTFLCSIDRIIAEASKIFMWQTVSASRPCPESFLKELSALLLWHGSIASVVPAHFAPHRYKVCVPFVGARLWYTESEWDRVGTGLGIYSNTAFWCNISWSWLSSGREKEIDLDTLREMESRPRPSLTPIFLATLCHFFCVFWYTGVLLIFLRDDSCWRTRTYYA